MISILWRITRAAISNTVKIRAPSFSVDDQLNPLGHAASSSEAAMASMSRSIWYLAVWLSSSYRLLLMLLSS